MSWSQPLNFLSENTYFVLLVAPPAGALLTTILALLIIAGLVHTRKVRMRSMLLTRYHLWLNMLCDALFLTWTFAFQRMLLSYKNYCTLVAFIVYILCSQTLSAYIFLVRVTGFIVEEHRFSSIYIAFLGAMFICIFVIGVLCSYSGMFYTSTLLSVFLTVPDVYALISIVDIFSTVFAPMYKSLSQFASGNTGISDMYIHRLGRLKHIRMKIILYSVLFTAYAVLYTYIMYIVCDAAFSVMKDCLPCAVSIVYALLRLVIIMLCI